MVIVTYFPNFFQISNVPPPVRLKRQFEVMLPVAKSHNYSLPLIYPCWKSCFDNFRFTLKELHPRQYRPSQNPTHWYFRYWCKIYIIFLNWTMNIPLLRYFLAGDFATEIVWELGCLLCGSKTLFPISKFYVTAAGSKIRWTSLEQFIASAIASQFMSLVLVYDASLYPRSGDHTHQAAWISS